MTSNFIPYLPSSPPPLDDGDDDDDEFGSFTIANHLCNSKVNECKGLRLTGKTSMSTSTEKEIEATEILHNNACDWQNRAECLNNSEIKCPSNDKADLPNSDDSHIRVTKSDEEDSNSTNVYSQLSTETELSFTHRPLVTHSSEKDNGEHSICIESAVDTVSDILHQSEDIPDSLDTSQTKQFPQAEECLHSEAQADESNISSTETNHSLTVNKLNSSDNALSDNDKQKDELNDSVSLASDTAGDFFGNFESNPEGDAFQLNDSSITCDGCDPMTNLNISTTSLDVQSAIDESNDERREHEESKNDVTNIEQWDSFISCSQTASAANDEDEFSDFVCPPSEDSIQSSQCPVDAGWPRAEPAEKNKTTVPSGSNIGKFSTETFHPTFEAHFSDTVSRCGTKLSVKYSLDQISQVVLSSFPTSSSLEEEEYNNLDSISDVTNKSEDENYNVWPYVCDIDKMNALTFQWSNSSGNKKFLKAINIDSRNLLFGHNWNSSVPLFAANLSLNPLEPIKTPLKSADTEDSELFSPPPQDVLPPAQFDWNSSGLINPLDASNGISALLDLDFFFTNETGSVNPVPSATWSLENELLGSDATTEENEHKQFNSRVSPLLEQILSNAKLSASNFTKMKQSTSHTPEAQVVLNKLPDLSFMQAKVLMFPIRSSSP